MLQRSIPSTGESLPAIGMGTWKTFDRPLSGPEDELSFVLQDLHKAGGKLIDSSPMYGRAEESIGELTEATGLREDFFYATKVWTTGKQEGIEQMGNSFRLMNRKVIDLIQIHNLVDFDTHLETLREWKSKGRIRYIGVTHYLDESHEKLEKLMRTVPDLDFIQFNYSFFSRHAEERLLPAAINHGVATLINRPFGVGGHFSRVSSRPVPSWAVDAGMKKWSQFFLKYILANPGVTCVIPATSNPRHMADNLLAGEGELPDEAMRKRMLEEIKE